MTSDEAAALLLLQQGRRGEVNWTDWQRSWLMSVAGRSLGPAVIPAGRAVGRTFLLERFGRAMQEVSPDGR